MENKSYSHNGFFFLCEVCNHFKLLLVSDFYQVLIYSKTCLKQTLKKNIKIGFQYWLSLNVGQKYGAFCNTFDLH